MKYNQWLDIWLENYVKPTSKIKTYTIYKQIVATRKRNYGYRIICEYSERYYNRNSELTENRLYDRRVRKVYCRQNKTTENE